MVAVVIIIIDTNHFLVVVGIALFIATVTIQEPDTTSHLCAHLVNRHMHTTPLIKGHSLPIGDCHAGHLTDTTNFPSLTGTSRLNQAIPKQPHLVRAAGHQAYCTNLVRALRVLPPPLPPPRVLVVTCVSVSNKLNSLTHSLTYSLTPLRSQWSVRHQQSFVYVLFCVCFVLCRFVSGLIL